MAIKFIQSIETKAISTSGDVFIDGDLEVESDGDRLMYLNKDNGNFYIGDVDGLGDGNWIEGNSVGLNFYTGESIEMRLEGDGDLHVDGDVIAYSTTISDKRLKKDIVSIKNATEIIKELSGVFYTWKSGKRKDLREPGLIAQEVAEVIPEIVHEKTILSGETVFTVDYEKIIAVLIESNKELSARLDKLENK